MARLDALDYLDSLLDLVRKGKCLLVLDGLDEVPYDLRQRVRQFVGALIENYSPERIIVTCRIRSYSGAAEIPGFERSTLAPFDKDKITNFIHAWYNASKEHYSVDKLKTRQDDLTKAALSTNLFEMASNPMLLTVMAIIHQQDVHLPPQKVKLYRRAVEILLLRWQKHKSGELSNSPRLEQFLNCDQRLYPALERLAFEAHRVKRENHQDAPELLRKDAIDLLERNECYCEDGYPLANEFLDYVDQRAGLMVGKGEAPGVPASYSFPHRTFQEYLAGCYLASQRYFFRAIRPLAAEGDTWDLVVQMAFEELFYNSRGSVYTLLDVSYDLCQPRSCDNEAQQQRLTLWAGQIAVLIGKNEYEKDVENLDRGKEFLKKIPTKLITVMGGCLPPVERAEAGNSLACLGDPRFRADFWYLPDEPLLGFVHIPAGKFLMGSNKMQDSQANDDELPQHEVEVGDYYLARYPVTVAQFKLFIKDSGYKEYRPQALNGIANHPVVYVSWHVAIAYCNWLTEQLKKWEGIPPELAERIQQGWRITLPSEAQWERAARGTGGQIYPWKGEFDSNKANTDESGIGGTSSVGCFPGGASPEGLVDISGNVWEWTRSIYKKYPYQPLGEERSKVESLTSEKNERYVLRGGSWYDYQRYCRCTFRNCYDPCYEWFFTGFRLGLCPPSLFSVS